MHPGIGGQFDHIAVRVAEIDRAAEAVIDRAAHLDPMRLALLEHAVEHLVVDTQRYVQVEIVLPLELEGLAGRFEKRETRAVTHLKEGVQRLPVAYLERADEGQAEEVLIESARLLRVAAAIGIVVQSFDVAHASLLRVPELQLL